MKNKIKFLVLLFLTCNLSTDLRSQETKQVDISIIMNLGISPTPSELQYIEPQVWEQSQVQNAINKLNNAVLSIQDNKTVKAAIAKGETFIGKLSSLIHSDKELFKKYSQFFVDAAKTKEFQDARTKLKEIEDYLMKKLGINKLQEKLDQEKDPQKHCSIYLQLKEKYKLYNEDPSLISARTNFWKIRYKKLNELGLNEFGKQQAEKINELKKQIPGFIEAEQELEKAVGPEVIQAKKEYEQAIQDARKDVGL